MNIEKIIEKFGPPPQWTPNTQGTRMNEIIRSYADCFEDVISISPYVCDCPIHEGDTLYQVNAKIRGSGVPIVMMQDKYGYHITIGRYDPRNCPPGVDKEEALQIIREAISL